MAALHKEQLGELISERRHLLGLTQAELAQRAHVKESTTVSRWERGERAPNDLDAVAKALDTTAGEMLSQLSSVKQADRRRMQPRSDVTQLDRIEQKLDELLSQLSMSAAGSPEPEIDEALEQDELSSTSSAASAHSPHRRRRAT